MRSKIAKISVKRGESLNPAFTVSVPAFGDISSDDWNAHYVLRARNVTGEVVYSQDLVKDTGATMFIFNMTPDETAALDVGNYFLSISVKNVALDTPISQEIVQCPFIVDASGVLSI